MRAGIAGLRREPDRIAGEHLLAVGVDEVEVGRDPVQDLHAADEIVVADAGKGLFQERQGGGPELVGAPRTVGERDIGEQRGVADGAGVGGRGGERVGRLVELAVVRVRAPEREAHPAHARIGDHPGVVVADRFFVPTGGLGEREAGGRIVAGAFRILGGLGNDGVPVEVSVEVAVEVDVLVVARSRPSARRPVRRRAASPKWRARSTQTDRADLASGCLECLAHPLVQPRLTIFGHRGVHRVAREHVGKEIPLDVVDVLDE